jgi:hypothetical protein
MCLDVNNFFLGTPMDSFEYMRIPTKVIPHEIIDQYNLLPLVYDGHVYVDVQKCMRGLPQAGILANQLLAHRLAIHGYHQTKFTQGIWQHVTRPIQFTLVVDDFGVKYVGAEHAHHLIAALETDYTVSKDWKGSLYCGITLNWDYANKHVDLSMPISKMPCTSFNIHCPNAPNMHHTIGRSRPTANASSMCHCLTRYRLQQLQKSHGPKQLWAPSSTMLGRWIQRF